MARNKISTVLFLFAAILFLVGCGSMKPKGGKTGGSSFSSKPAEQAPNQANKDELEAPGLKEEIENNLADQNDPFRNFNDIANGNDDLVEVIDPSEGIEDGEQAVVPDENLIAHGDQTKDLNSDGSNDVHDPSVALN